MRGVRESSQPDTKKVGCLRLPHIFWYAWSRSTRSVDHSGNCGEIIYIRFCWILLSHSSPNPCMWVFATRCWGDFNRDEAHSTWGQIFLCRCASFWAVEGWGTSAWTTLPPNCPRPIQCENSYLPMMMKWHATHLYLTKQATCLW